MFALFILKNSYEEFTDTRPAT